MILLQKLAQIKGSQDSDGSEQNTTLHFSSWEIFLYYVYDKIYVQSLLLVGSMYVKCLA